MELILIGMLFGAILVYLFVSIELRFKDRSLSFWREECKKQSFENTKLLRRMRTEIETLTNVSVPSASVVDPDECGHDWSVTGESVNASGYETSYGCVRCGLTKTIKSNATDRKWMAY